MQEKLEEYILNHIDPEPEMMQRLNRDTHIYHLYSRMCSGHLQGRMLKMFTRMIRPQRILELGAFTGYSARRCRATHSGDRRRDRRFHLGAI